MARIRSVHPALFTDESFVSLSDSAQIFWVGLWCEADDQGVFEWKPLTLKMRIRPAATYDIEPIMGELEVANCIKPFEFDGRRFGVIRNFAKHQRPKSPKDVHPLPPELRNYAGFNVDGTRPEATTGRKQFRTGSEIVPNEFRTDSEISSQMEDVGWRMEEVGCRGELSSETTGLDDAAPSASRRRSSGSDEPYAFEAGVIRLNAKDLEAWRRDYPNLSLEAELRSLSEWAGRRPENAKGWFHAVQGGLAKRNRESALAVERVKAEATARAHAPPARQPSAYVP